LLETTVAILYLIPHLLAHLQDVLLLLAEVEAVQHQILRRHHQEVLAVVDLAAAPAHGAVLAALDCQAKETLVVMASPGLSTVVAAVAVQGLLGRTVQLLGVELAAEGLLLPSLEL
jgi:hypothetical protein